MFKGVLYPRRSPKPQWLYVNVVDGTIGVFDSWASIQYEGFYRLSTGKFVKLRQAHMREATSEEERTFRRAKRERVECMIRVEIAAASSTPSPPAGTGPIIDAEIVDESCQTL